MSKPSNALSEGAITSSSRVQERIVDSNHEEKRMESIAGPAVGPLPAEVWALCLGYTDAQTQENFANVNRMAQRIAREVFLQQGRDWGFIKDPHHRQMHCYLRQSAPQLTLDDRKLFISDHPQQTSVYELSQQIHRVAESIRKAYPEDGVAHLPAREVLEWFSALPALKMIDGMNSFFVCEPMCSDWRYYVLFQEKTINYKHILSIKSSIFHPLKNRYENIFGKLEKIQALLREPSKGLEEQDSQNSHPFQAKYRLGSRARETLSQINQWDNMTREQMTRDWPSFDNISLWERTALLHIAMEKITRAYANLDTPLDQIECHGLLYRFLLRRFSSPEDCRNIEYCRTIINIRDDQTGYTLLHKAKMVRARERSLFPISPSRKLVVNALQSAASTCHLLSRVAEIATEFFMMLALAPFTVWETIGIILGTIYSLIWLPFSFGLIVAGIIAYLLKHLLSVSAQVFDKLIVSIHPSHALIKERKERLDDIISMLESWGPLDLPDNEGIRPSEIEE